MRKRDVRAGIPANHRQIPSRNASTTLAGQLRQPVDHEVFVKVAVAVFHGVALGAKDFEASGEIEVARGGVVAHDGECDLLQASQLASAGDDVYEQSAGKSFAARFRGDVHARDAALVTKFAHRVAGEGNDTSRSEERRVGKECRSRWS